ncbi:MAG: MFS transporter [Bryobacterales bacterium]|nr:MFS transporter [Bryobacterales bacterium]
MKPSRVHYSVVALAVLIDMMSYMDRVCISVAAPKIREEFGFSPSQVGLIFSIFSLSYFLFQTFWGAMADRFGARGIVSLAILWWSAFTGFTALAWNFVSLLVIRFCFGAVEAALSPAIASAFSRWVPVTERSTAFGAFLGGGRTGGAVTPAIAAFLLLRYGWRAMFVVFAGLGLFWAALWWFWYRNSPSEHRFVNEAELERIGALVVPAPASAGRAATAKFVWSKPLVNLLAVAFGSTFLWQFFITWFPTYLMENRGFTLTQAAGYAGLPFLFGVGANWMGGLATDALGRRFTPGAARAAMGFFGLTFAAAFMTAGMLWPERGTAAVLMALCAFSADLYLGAAWASAVAIGGKAGGTVAGLMNSSSNAAAFASPLLMGWVLQTYHNWNAVLGLGVATTLIAAVLWLNVNPREAPRE